MKIEPSEGSAFACQPNAMNAQERIAYTRLMLSLDFKNRPVTELPDGLALTFPKDPTLIRDAAEWMTYEMLCCPFFAFSLEIGLESEFHLELRGPDGIKPFIRSEFELL